MKRLVILGASGFVGSSLSRHLQTGHYLIVPASRNHDVPGFEHADLNDLTSLKRVLRPGDVVINAAGYANATDTSEEGKNSFERLTWTGCETWLTLPLRSAPHILYTSAV